VVDAANILILFIIMLNFTTLANKNEWFPKLI
jgi:hypothetical protein